MKYSAEDFNILCYLLTQTEVSYESAVAWANSQYTDEGIDPFIEKIALASDVSDIVELIVSEYQVSGEPSGEFLLGEAAAKYEQGKLALGDALKRALYYMNAELPEDDLAVLYEAEDYFDWHDNPEAEAIKLAKPIFDKYMPLYERALARFSTAGHGS